VANRKQTRGEENQYNNRSHSRIRNRYFRNTKKQNRIDFEQCRCVVLHTSSIMSEQNFIPHVLKQGRVYNLKKFNAGTVRPMLVIHLQGTASVQKYCSRHKNSVLRLFSAAFLQSLCKVTFIPNKTFPLITSTHCFDLLD
jgi:hypothetical protein